MTDWPMPPAPMTTTVSPGWTLARLSTAPAPVTTAQPMRQAASNGMSLSITTAWLSATTVRSVNTPALANWKAFSPPTVNGRLSLPAVSRQWVGWPRSQASHRPQLPSVVSTTWSPTCTLWTATPISSTTPAPSWPSTTGVGNGMVPSSTDTSEWHRPALTMRTTTSWGRGPRTSTSSRTSSSPVQTIPRISSNPPGRQDLAGEAGVGLQLAVDHDRHAVDDGGVDALRLRRPAGGAVREVVGEVLLVGADGVGVEDHDVGGVAGEEQAAVGEAAQRGGDGGDLADALLEREAAPLAHPVLEEPGVGLGAVVAVEVGAAVGRAHDHVRVVLGDLRALDPLRRLGLPDELDGEVLGGGDVEEGVGGVHAALGGDVDERAADELLVLGLGDLVDVEHGPGRRRQRRAGVGVAVGVVDRVADGVAEGRVGDEGQALRHRGRLGEEAVELRARPRRAWCRRRGRTCG